jgi:hypothetical protein
MPRMPKPRRRIALVLATAVVALASFVAIAQALNPPATIGGSKHKDGPFATDGQAKVRVGESRDLWFRAKSESPDPQTLDLRTFDENRPTYRVKWFKGRQDITNDVSTGDGYEFNLGANKKKLFRVHVKRLAGGEFICLDASLYTTTDQFVSGADIAINNNGACF